MSSTITTSVVTGGTNSHATTVSEINAFRSDFASPGVVGTISLNAGSGGTGSFAVNAQGTPAMFVDLKAGSAYITATPAGQVSQLLRAYMASDYTSYAISANSSGSTKYDWIYLSVDATKANNPASDASDVTSLVTSRSSSNTTDNGSPPTYGTLLAIVTVANGASSITNSNITDMRTNASLSTVATNTYFFDFIESGCVWTADSAGSTLNASMTSGIVWISGKRLRVAAVSGRAFTASKDVYVDFSDNGDGTALLTYTNVSNNAASPALASGAIRNAIVVTGASNIAASTSINQGQESRVLPIASSIPYAITDSLGNLICPRDPNRSLLGGRIVTSDQNTSSSTYVDITGMNVTVNIPTGRRVRVTAVLSEAYNTSTIGAGMLLNIYDVTSSVQIAEAQARVVSASSPFVLYATAVYTPPASGSRNFKCQFETIAGGTAHTGVTSTNPGTLLVELV